MTLTQAQTFKKTLQHACFGYEPPPSNLMIVGVEK